MVYISRETPWWYECKVCHTQFQSSVHPECGSLVTPEEETKYWQSRFSILDGWDIVYGADGDYVAECTVIADRRKAHIKPYGSEPMPKDYILHEIYHISLRAFLLYHKILTSARFREIEEAFVQDLCVTSIGTGTHNVETH